MKLIKRLLIIAIILFIIDFGLWLNLVRITLSQPLALINHLPVISDKPLADSEPFQESKEEGTREMVSDKTAPPEKPAVKTSPVAENNGAGSKEAGVEEKGQACRLLERRAYARPNFCSFDWDAPVVSIGQGPVGIVWGEPFEVKNLNKDWAMALAAAGKLLKIDPNYLLAIAIKESRLNCSLADGCFQITPDAFNETKKQFPFYFQAGQTHQSDTRDFARSVLDAGLYFKFSQSLFERWYQANDFWRTAADREAKAKTLTWAYNRGLWHQVLAEIFTTQRNVCQAQNNLNACFPPSETIALDHNQAVISYCQKLNTASQVYNSALAWSEVDDFINNTLKNKFYANAFNDWPRIKKIARETFNCLAKDGKISFQNDFGIILDAILAELPKPPEPQAASDYFAPAASSSSAASLFQDNFEDAGASAEKWQLVYNGLNYIDAFEVKNGSAVLKPKAAVSAGETHAVLLTAGEQNWQDYTFAARIKTEKQLRQGSAPNPWETAWLLFRYINPDNFYYFIFKTNGVELGKVVNDQQIFLATKNEPKMTPGQWANIKIELAGPRIKIFINEQSMIDITDPQPRLNGKIGLYTEDALVKFDDILVTAGG